jgi:hypothetical protein
MSDLSTITQAARWDLLIQQGSSFERVLNFGATSTADVSFRGHIRRSHDDPCVLAEFVFTDLGPDENGHERLKVSLTPAQTELLPAERLVFDIEAFTADESVVTRLFEGRVTVTPEATRVYDLSTPCPLSQARIVIVETAPDPGDQLVGVLYVVVPPT